MVRLKNIPNGFQKPEYIPCAIIGTVCSESLADKSYFKPEEAIVKTGVALGNVITPEMYMFPDGKDNGMDIPIGSRIGVDLAEVSQSAILNQKQVSDELKVLDDKIAYRKEREKAKAEKKAAEQAQLAKLASQKMGLSSETNQD
ncbi:hypothetical protein [Microvirus sp.]|nr:hypothetical protein [Microvirus sp.]